MEANNKNDNPFEDVAKCIEKNLEEFKKKAIDNSQAVKDGVLTPEEELQEPVNIMFTQISETVIKILRSPGILQGFYPMSEATNIEAMKDFMTAIASVATNAAYQSVLFYDGRLKEELGKQLTMMCDYSNLQASEITALKSACDVYNKRIGKLEEALKLKEISEQI